QGRINGKFFHGNISAGGGSEAGYFGNTLPVFSDPHIPFRIYGNPIGLAIRRWRRRLDDFVCFCIEKAYAIAVVFSKPEIAMLIKGQIIGSAPLCNTPLVEDLIISI